jgi:hypothetical protein
MHPLFSRATRVVLYCAAWIGIGLLLAAFLRLVTPRPWAAAVAFAVPAAVLEGFVVLSAWWVCLSYPLVGARIGRAIAGQLGAMLASSAAWTALAAVLATALSRSPALALPAATVRRDLWIVFVTGLLLYLLSAVAHSFGLAVRASHAAERRALESQVTAREAELRALRAQLNPHFLFNSLNSINALVGSEPEAARRMCERLGAFLRRTLALGARDAVTMGEELALVDQYLDIEQVRFGDRLRVERAVESAALACRVPPLLLQPLVENAVKHGVQDCVAGGVIRLAARRDGSRLELSVDNPVDPDAPVRRGEGVGLANVRRRLEVFGSQGARLETTRDGDRFRVTLVLPAVEASGAEVESGRVAAAIAPGGSGDV